MWLGTFHSIGVRVLRRHAELVGLKSNFTILDTDDQMRLIKQLLQAEGIDDKKWPARVLSGVIQRWKDRALTPDKVSSDDAGEFANGKAAEIYKQYQARLAEVNAVDFGDLLLHCVTLWQQHPDVLEQYQRRFRYILVDEYQDTNVAQYLWLRLLAQGTQDVCCVGDDDQSIYGWRGAEVGNILRFEKDFPGATIVRLERNYRSTPHILAAASGLIAHNQGRLGKTLWTEVKEGERISLRGVWDGDEEARTIGEEIEALQRDKHALSQIAILVRAGFQTREFEERFITLGLPYRVIGGPRFYERQEIRDALAYLPGHGAARRRSGLRAHLQHAAPRPGRIGAAHAAHHPARPEGVAVRGGAAGARDRRAEGPPAQGAGRPGPELRPLARDARRPEPRRGGRDAARRVRATPRCCRPTARPRRRAGWRTSRS